ncbi:MAG: FprA family A-type flavoprotein [Bacteroidales bacterium]
MKAVEITKDIYWVGAIDSHVRNFHGYLTQKGTTYNAYLILDEKITLIDTVKDTHTDEMMSRISDVIDPSKIDVVICNHVEPDHSGSMPAVLEHCPNATVVTCPNGKKGLEMHYQGNWNYHIVKSGDTFSIGKRSCNFVLTPMVHWPDNMIFYMPEEKILFSNDSFGQHYATSERFDDEVIKDFALFEAKKYYANIVLPYSNQVKKELESASQFDISMICTSHGVIWRSYIPEILSHYKEWSHNMTKKKVVIAYDTMWKTTEKMATAIYEAFETKGYEIKIHNLQVSHESDIMTEIIDAEYICVGSPTLNSEIMANVAKFLTYMRGLAPKDGRKAIAFGSYGWNAKSVAHIEQYFKESNFDVELSFNQQYRPTKENLQDIKEQIINHLP